MVAPLSRTAVLVFSAVLLCGHRALAARAGDEEGPPTDAVAQGLAIAKSELESRERQTAQALQAATELVAHTQGAMMDAIKNNDLTGTEVAMTKFEAALATKKSAEKAAADAKELHSMVQSHNAQVSNFFNEVAAFQRHQQARDVTREAYWKGSRAEVAHAISLTELFQGMQRSVNTIGEKDAELGNVGVHAAVTTGFKAVQMWANGETQKVCQKYSNAPGDELTQVREMVKANSADGVLRCRALLKALLDAFPVELAPEM